MSSLSSSQSQSSSTQLITIDARACTLCVFGMHMKHKQTNAHAHAHNEWRRLFVSPSYNWMGGATQNTSTYGHINTICEYVTHHQNRESEFIRFVATHFAHNKHSRVREVCEESQNHAGARTMTSYPHTHTVRKIAQCVSFAWNVQQRPFLSNPMT